MAKFKFFGISEADAEIKSADAAINPLLTAANITTIDVNGKPLPATSDEVPLAAKITALSATHKTGNGDEQMNQVLANNKILASQAKDLTAKLASAETSVSSLTSENATLQERNEVLNASVKTLTASNAEITNLRAAAVDEAGRVTAQLNGLNSEISRRALSIGCLVDLRDPKTKELLPSTATATEKELAADMIPAGDKLSAIFGAVNMAASRIGVDLKDKPAATPPGAQAATREVLVGRYQALLAEKKPAEAAAFYKANLAK